MKQYDNLAKLRLSLNRAGQTIYVKSHTTEGDGGGGEFWLDTSDTSTADDNGINIVDSVSPRIGTWKRIYSGAINVKWFGAVGDGVTDDTTAIQAAVDSLSASDGLIFPQGDYLITDEITVTTSFISIYGTGYAKIIQQTDNKAIFAGSSCSGDSVHDLRFSGSANATSTRAACVSMTSCIGWTVTDCQFFDFSGAGVKAITSEKIKVTGCTFENARYITAITGDISFVNSDKCSATNNRCFSGGAVAIDVTTNGNGTCNDCIITDNQIDGYERYGIINYNNRDGGQTGQIENAIVSNNTVKNIQGSEGVATNKQFGAGIYMLCTEHAVITGNVVEACNIDTDNNSLSPAGIGLANTSAAVISGNSLYDCRYYGIMVNDSLQFGDGTNNGSSSFIPDGGIVVEGNNIINADNLGVYVKSQHNVAVEGNSIWSCEKGIVTEATNANYPELRNYVINGNNIYDCVNAGMSLEDLRSPVVSNNSVSGCGGTGLQVYADGYMVTGNVLYSNLNGIDVRATSSNTVLTGNKIELNSSSGLIGGAPWRDGGGNWIDSYAGTYDEQFNLADDATPSVKDGNLFSTGGTTTITNFDDGHLKQRIIIRSEHSVTITHASGGIRLSGSANFAMNSGDTLTLIKTTATTWDEIGRMVR